MKLKLLPTRDYRLPVGDHRIINEAEDDTRVLTIVRIGHRGTSTDGCECVRVPPALPMCSRESQLSSCSDGLAKEWNAVGTLRGWRCRVVRVIDEAVLKGPRTRILPKGHLQHAGRAVRASRSFDFYARSA